MADTKKVAPASSGNKNTDAKTNGPSPEAKARQKNINNARNAALRRLSEMHEDDFEDLMREEAEERGLRIKTRVTFA